MLQNLFQQILLFKELTGSYLNHNFIDTMISQASSIMLAIWQKTMIRHDLWVTNSTYVIQQHFSIVKIHGSVF